MNGTTSVSLTASRIHRFRLLSASSHSGWVFTNPAPMMSPTVLAIVSPTISASRIRSRFRSGRTGRSPSASMRGT